MEENTKRWTDGMSAIVCVLAAVLIFFVAILLAKDRTLQIGCLCVAGFGLICAMAFFWSALWKSRCRDIWAWVALILGIIAVGLPEFVRFK